MFLTGVKSFVVLANAPIFDVGGAKKGIENPCRWDFQIAIFGEDIILVFNFKK